MNVTDTWKQVNVSGFNGGTWSDNLPKNINNSGYNFLFPPSAGNFPKNVTESEEYFVSNLTALDNGTIVDTNFPLGGGSLAANGSNITLRYLDVLFSNISSWEPVENVTLNEPLNVTIWQQTEYKWGAISLGLIILISLIGNIMVCMAVYMEKKLQNMTNYFLTSLAISDLLVAGFVMPMAIYHTVAGKLFI